MSQAYLFFTPQGNMVSIQLDLFEKDETRLLQHELDKVKKSQDKCRRKQFAEIGEMKKLLTDLAHRVQLLENKS